MSFSKMGGASFVLLVLLVAIIDNSSATLLIPSTDFLPRNVSSCLVQKRFNPSIRCHDDGSFRPLQCELQRCWCVFRNGTRVNQRTFEKTDNVSDRTCDGVRPCPQVRCTLEAYKKCLLHGFAEDSNGCITCDCRDPCSQSVVELQRRCGLRCIGYRDRCPYCRSGCNMTDSTTCMCDETQECVRLGFGSAICRQRLSENTTCVRPIDEEEDDEDTDDRNDDDDGEEIADREELDQITSEEEDEEQMEEDRRARGSLLGSSARRAARRFRRAQIRCNRDDYCKRIGLTRSVCTRRNMNGPCTRRPGGNNEECDNNGYFRPRICRAGSRRGTLVCACVFPNNGTRLPEITVNEGGRRPSCIRKVYPSCRVSLFGRSLTIQHGRTFVNPCRCTYCKCYLGRLRCTSRRTVCLRNCTVIQSCTLPNGSQLGHGQSTQVDCNRCSCRLGRLYCTDRDCDDDSGRNNTCARCSLEPMRRVCGRNGRTYPNRCFAVNCAGISSVDILEGACPSINPCQLHPCANGEVCLRKGWVFCLARGGCRPNSVRSCVNITDLSCDDYNTTMETDETDQQEMSDDELGSGDVDPSDTRVCGTDGTTYSTTCQLLQRTANINVRYAGRCNSSRCRGGQVCGSDGVTYENVCALRSQSGGARVDYRGECVEEDDEPSVRRICEIVERRGLCADRNSTCRRLVRPSVGCCPICGGALLIAIDQAGLADAALVDSGLTTLDDLMERIVRDEAFQPLQGRCMMEASSTATGNVEVVLRPMRSPEQDAQFCFDQAENITRMINTPTSDSSASFQFMLSASTARSINQLPEPTPTPGPGDGAGSTAALSFLALTMIAFITAMFF